MTPQARRAWPETSVPMIAAGGGGLAARNIRTSSGASPASTSTIRTRPPSAWSIAASSGKARWQGLHQVAKKTTSVTCPVELPGTPSSGGAGSPTSTAARAARSNAAVTG